MSSTIGVKGLFLFKKYKVIKYYLSGEINGIDAYGKDAVIACPVRLILELTNHDIVVIENITSRTWKVYKDKKPWLSIFRPGPKKVSAA